MENINPEIMSPEKIEAIKHYQEMIACAKSLPQKDSANRNIMFAHIGHMWYGSYCSYCNKYNGICRECPLKATKIGEEVVVDEQAEDYDLSYSCCAGLWKKMNEAKTWGEWVICAEAVLDYIIKNG